MSVYCVCVHILLYGCGGGKVGVMLYSCAAYVYVDYKKKKKSQVFFPFLSLFPSPLSSRVECLIKSQVVECVGVTVQQQKLFSAPARPSMIII